MIAGLVMTGICIGVCLFIFNSHPKKRGYSSKELDRIRKMNTKEPEMKATYLRRMAREHERMILENQRGCND